MIKSNIQLISSKTSQTFSIALRNQSKGTVKKFNSWNIVEQLEEIKPFNLGINQDLIKTITKHDKNN